MAFPVGLDAVKVFYGDPRPYVLMDGGVDPAWEQLILGYVHLPRPIALGWDPKRKVVRIRVHRKLTESLGNLLEEIAARDLWGALKTFDGTYAWRPKRTSAQQLSLHCWGAAVDFNAETNRLGTLGDMPWEIVDAFNRAGWEWGGEWHHADPMHFQAAFGV